MRYNLGYLDKYHFEATGSAIENDPLYRVTLKQPIDPIRLEAAVKDALIAYPLFATQVEFDREYYLRTNDRPLVIERYTESDRPRTFGRNTNGYPWRIFYDNCTLYFEWNHGITDGSGAISFLEQILLCYFGEKSKKRTLNYLVAPGLEPFNDLAEQGRDYLEDPQGFSPRVLPSKYKGYLTDYHLLYADSSELLNLSRNTHSSVAAVFIILFSRALRSQLPEDCKNRDVACYMLINLRKILHYQTMHNCVCQRRMTYVDDYDSLSFADLAGIYHRKIESAKLEPNLIRAITEQINVFKSYHILPIRKWLRAAVHIVARHMSATDCNFEFSYLGKLNFPPEILSHIDDFAIKLWHDFGQTAIIAWELDGTFGVGICENFAKKGFVENFIALSRSLGVHWEEAESSVYEQAHFEE